MNGNFRVYIDNEDGKPGGFEYSEAQEKQRPYGWDTDKVIKMSASEGVIPDIPGHENLPPLHFVSYSAISADVRPTVSFQEIYKHMILRQTRSGKAIDNHKGLDKAD